MTKFLSKYYAFVALMRALGWKGVMVIAAVDASALGVPMDPLVGTYVYNDPHHFWVYALAASIGSCAGSLVPYAIGRVGGELLLLKRVDRRRFESMRSRFERQEFLAILIPSTLPPPTPFKLFVLSAGVFEMRVLLFVVAIFIGRMIRFSVLSLLVIYFGPGIVSTLREAFVQHPVLAGAGLGALLALIYFLFRLWTAPAKELAHEIEEHSAERVSGERSD